MSCTASAVELPVGCRRPGAPDGWALGPVEHPELDPAPVGCPAHDAVQGVDLPDQMPLPRPPMAGLQDISPMVESLWVTSAVRAPVAGSGRSRLGSRHGRRR